MLLVLALLALAFLRYGRIERELSRAVIVKNYSGTVTPEGTNILNALGSDAIPILLRWAAGKQPFWHKAVNPVRVRLGQKPLEDDLQANKEKARAAFFFLRERGQEAVPVLLGRLADPTVATRRFSIHMLGAIGPSIGTNAFHQMTNRLSDADNDIRNDVLWALQFHRCLDYPAGMLIPVFVTGLKDSQVIARQNAMIGLAELGEKAQPAEVAIKAALSDSDPGVVAWATNWVEGKYLKR